MATFFSAFALMGAPGMLHQHGLAFVPFFLNPLVAGLLIWVVGNRIRSASVKNNWITPSDLICHAFPSQVVNVLVCLVGFFYVLPYIVLQIKAGGYLFEVLTDGQINRAQGAVILALITMVYVHIGGMRSVAWTDLVQGILLLAGMVWSGWAAWRAVTELGQGGFFEALNRLDIKYLSFPGAKGFFSPQMLLTMSLAGAVGAMLSPGQWLRYNAARSAKDLKRSALLFAICLTGGYLLGTFFIGLAGKILYPDLAQPDQITLIIVRDHLPLWAAALLMVAIMAASMSTADSNLHALGAVISKDIFKGFLFPQAGPKAMMRVAHAVIALTTLIALAIVIKVPNLGMLVKIGILSLSICFQLTPVVFDIFWIKKGRTPGAIIGMIAGLLTLYLLFFVFKANPLGIHCGIWAGLINGILFWGVSAITPETNFNTPSQPSQ